MKIVPAAPNSELTWTEQKVFRMVREVQWGGAAIALSSVNLSAHEYKRWGEVDFVIACEAGLLAIEVKGGAVSCHGGEWQYRSSHGTIKRKESPFAQASGGFFALERHIAMERALRVHAPVPGGFSVLFASMERKDLEGVVGGPEMPAELTGCADDLADAKAFARYLDRVSRYWTSRQTQPRTWDPATIKAVAGFLRPEFDRAVPLSLRIRAVREERVQFTEEQYSLLEFLADEPRLFVTGGAGCGKTFIALEAARREAASGGSVLLVTGTDTLAGYLRGAGDLPEAVTTLSASELQHRAQTGRPADIVIVDEGQQVTSLETYMLLDNAIAGGMCGGRWRWFGDYARQVALDSKVDEEVYRLLVGASRQQHLYQNCRNTPQLLQAAEVLSGVKIGRPLMRGAGPQLAWVTDHKREGLVQRAAAQLESWLSSDVSGDDIVLLHASDWGAEEALQVAGAAGINAVNWRDAFQSRVRGRHVSVASIRGFRGLESEYILLLGLEDVPIDAELRALAYVGVTRATFGAAICCTVAAKQRMMLLAAGPG